jgi:hypothetical protein
VTLVLTVNGPESAWVVADRRLSYAGRMPKDDARKLIFLETTDGVAILSYTGLGATARGTEPAVWMSSVLRGRNFPLEQSLGVLAEAMQKQLPPHLLKVPGDRGPTHSVIASAFVGNEPRLYTIDMAFAQDRRRYQFRYTRHVVDASVPAKARTPRFARGGSGALYLSGDKQWKRSLLRLVRAHDRGQVSPRTVADYLASLNYRVHLAVTDRSVGPGCIVAWRHMKEGVHKGGGGHQFYTGLTRDSSSPSLPAIANGMDIHAVAGVLMPHMTKWLEAMPAGQTRRELDVSALNAGLAHLPDGPDEILR